MSDSSERLNQISAELSALLEARVQELLSAMRETERITRQIVSTEVEIARARSTRESLASESVELEKELAVLRAGVESVHSTHSGLADERKRLRDAVAQREREVREGDAENDDARRRLAALDDASDALRRENADLRSKIRTLEENVARMRKLKEEMMLSISGLTQQMSSLNLTSKE